MKERHRGADSLKTLAAIFVITLHVNGYLSDMVSFEKFSSFSNIIWHLTEAVAYPAIHIFVMVSSYFFVETKDPVKAGMKVWLQTVFVCLSGLLLAMIFRVPFGGKEVLRSVFPFLGRAYWYVSDYIVLLFLVPILNKAIDGIGKKFLGYIVIVLFCFISIFPTFFAFLDWDQDYSNIGLFVLLYFIVAYLKTNRIASKTLGGVFCGEVQPAV